MNAQRQTQAAQAHEVHETQVHEAHASQASETHTSQVGETHAPRAHKAHALQARARAFQRARRRASARLRASRRARLLLLVALCALASAGTVIGCGWYGGSDRSVRFSGSTMREFERLPPLADSAEPTPTPGDWPEDEYDYEAEQRRERALADLWQAAQTAEARGDLAGERAALRLFMNDWQYADQSQRNTARDLLDALTALDEGAPAAAVQSYLKARRAYDDWLTGGTETSSQTADAAASGDAAPAATPAASQAHAPAPTDPHAALAAVPRHAALADNVAYLNAALAYQGREYDVAAHDFAALAARYPRSEKRAAALYMAGLARLKLSRSFTDEDEQPFVSGTSSPPCADCRDAHWRVAQTAFTRLLRADPRGAYAGDARGWLAFMRLRVGDTGAGLAEYYRMIAAGDAQARAEALRSLRLARAAATEADLARLEAELADEPAAALVYAYHNLYNYSVGYYLAVPETAEEKTLSEYVERNNEYDSYSARQLDRLRADSRQAAERRETERVARFTARLLARYPRTRIGGAFAARLACAQLELGDTAAAHKSAARALALGVAGDARADALWAKGVAEYRLKEYDAAQRTLLLLTATDAHGRLTEGARRLIAMAAEDAGDLDAALEQYLALDYKPDIAYFVDVLMTPDQLAAFIARHPHPERHDELTYALALRYLRAGQFDQARAVYARINTSEGLTASSYSSSSYERERVCAESLHTGTYGRAACLNPKYQEAYSDTPTHGVRKSWVLRDLQTINEIENLELRIANAVGDEQQAEALYQLASYYYESSLLFYNPAAWDGARYMQLSFLDEFDGYRAPGEAQALFAHMQEHDAAARALPLYLDIVKRFPRTRAARDAMYTAAVCHERLAGYNPYWRGVYEAGLHAGERMVTYADVRAAYPDYQLPRGTYGWEPSTRTVKGEPGFAAPPKPQPRPTRAERVRLKLLRAWIWLVELWETQLRRWVLLALVFGSTLLAARSAACARQLLRTELTRHPTVEPETDAPTRLHARPLFAQGRRGWWAAARAAPRTAFVALYRRTRPLLNDAPGRSALAHVGLTHAALAWLLYTFAWLVHASGW
jgi:TolA-binding protein